MNKYRNVKIRVNETNSGAVQMKLFDDGCKWLLIGKNFYALSAQYLFVDMAGIITMSSDDGDYFNKHRYEEITAQQILNTYREVKLAWANGDTVQYKETPCSEWSDWDSRSKILLGWYSEWRVKPKTKTIKQWERKYYANGRVITMTFSCDPGDVDGIDWLGDAYQAEYEVPNN